MAFKDDLETTVKQIFAEQWTKRNSSKVPDPADLVLGRNDAIEFDRATVLYADLSSSTALVDAKSWMFAAEIYKTFLHCAAQIIRKEGGTITAYDGDVLWLYSSESLRPRLQLAAALRSTMLLQIS
jgi:class 3 adenylate cyclase